MKLTLPTPFHAPLPVKLFAALGTGNLRYVGGCVRNVVLGLPIHDIDMATTHPPQEVMDILASHRIRTIPTGLKHGTVSVPFGQYMIEITTLRRDMTTDGRHAIVEFSSDWAADAARRDFTMNALYMDQDGQIFDPLGCGITDLKNHSVRFIGDASARIAEDYLRILRFFRFSLYYGDGFLEPQGLKACTQARAGLRTLSRERITQELTKIIIHDECVKMLEEMQGARILSPLYTRQKNWPHVLIRLINLQHAPSQTHPKLRLSHEMILSQRILALCGPRKCLPKSAVKDLSISEHLCLSRAQTNLIKKFAKLVSKKKTWTLFDFNLLRYENGEDFARAAAMILHAYDRIGAGEYQNWQNFQVTHPQLKPPFKAADYIARGMEGATLGKELKSATRRWLRQYSK